MVATKQTYSLHNLDQIGIATTLMEALFCKKEKTCVALFYMYIQYHERRYSRLDYKLYTLSVFSPMPICTLYFLELYEVR